MREILQELKYNHAKLPLGNAKATPLQGTVEVAEHSGPKDEAMVAQLKGTPEFAEHSRPKDDSVKSPYNCDSLKSSKEIQDVDDMLISQKDDATSTGIVEKVHPSLLSLYSKYTVHYLIWHLLDISIGQSNAWFSSVYALFCSPVANSLIF